MAKGISRKAKKIAAIVVASLVGVSVVSAASVIVVHDAIFDRYERPDYAIYPGLYSYDRVKSTLFREEIGFTSCGARLQGYHYPANDSRGLVVFAHGFKSGADDYLPIIEVLVSRGYSVFTYDGYGTYSSEGDSVIGMCQALRDIDAALKYVRSAPQFSSMPVFLLGYSWGGYAVTSVLSIHPWVSACAAIAPMNSGNNIMLEKSEEYVGKLGYATKPVLDAYQKYLFGEYVNYDGVKGINSVDIPVFIAHGADDTTITYDVQSVISHRHEITNPNVTYYTATGHAGNHTDILCSAAAVAYRDRIAKDYSDLEKSLGRELTYEEQCDFYLKVDHRLYSEVNAELLNMIFETYEKAKI